MIQKNKKKYQSIVEWSGYKCNTRKGKEYLAQGTWLRKQPMLKQMKDD